MESIVDTLEASLYNADCKLNVIVRQLESELANLDLKWQEKAEEHNIGGPLDRPMVSIIRMTTVLEQMRDSLTNLKTRYQNLKEEKEKYESEMEDKCNKIDNEMLEFAQQYGMKIEDIEVSDEEEVEAREELEQLSSKDDKYSDTKVDSAPSPSIPRCLPFTPK